MNRVYRSYHKQNRWLCEGSYRQPIIIDWRTLVTDAVIGIGLAGAILVVWILLLQEVAL